MALQVKSIASLMNEILNREISLPDLQRDFVWDEDQIRMLLDSIMRGYPFGSLLLWNTQFLDVVHRNFTSSYHPGQTFDTEIKSAGKKMRMVLDGQQRLQSLYLAFFGTYEGRKLYFNVTSGPESKTADAGDDLGRNYRFEFWKDDEPSRPKRLVKVADVIGWGDRFEDDEIEAFVGGVPLEGEEAALARRNLRRLRRLFTQDIVPIATIDDDVIKAEQATTIQEILEIFVRVNSGGTKLSRSDLMFSLIKTKWVKAREQFDALLADVDKAGLHEIDKDFLIRGMLTVSDAPTTFDVNVIERHWDTMEPKFPAFAAALRSAIDFCRSADVRILSKSLLRPVNTLLPVVYYLSRQPKGSVPSSERQRLRAFIYFLLFNEFLGGKSPEARVRYLREVFQKNPGTALPLDALLNVVAARQKHTSVTTTQDMLGWHPRLTLNIAQPNAARDTLSWQERAEVDHLFPQSVYRPLLGEAVDDLGNLAYLGKYRNIIKSDDLPWDYFKNVTDDELRDDFLIEDRSLLAHATFNEFTEKRRAAILAKVKTFLGR
jgi:hypothetical protein